MCVLSHDGSSADGQRNAATRAIVTVEFIACPVRSDFAEMEKLAEL